jgi:hypothetical protein
MTAIGASLITECVMAKEKQLGLDDQELPWQQYQQGHAHGHSRIAGNCETARKVFDDTPRRSGGRNLFSSI